MAIILYTSVAVKQSRMFAMFHISHCEKNNLCTWEPKLAWLKGKWERKEPREKKSLGFRKIDRLLTTLCFLKYLFSYSSIYIFSSPIYFSGTLSVCYYSGKRHNTTGTLLSTQRILNKGCIKSFMARDVSFVWSVFYWFFHWNKRGRVHILPLFFIAD